MWLVNVYLNKGKIRRIQKLIAALRSEIPENEWSIICCVGDFNVDMIKKTPESEMMTKLSKLMGLRVILPSKPNRNKTYLDFLLAGEKILTEELPVANGPSDHKLFPGKLK